VRGRERFVTLDFHARFGIERSLPNPANMPPDWTGRWAVDFASDDLPAVGLFDQDRTRLVATFMTSTGDYRYLAGDVRIDGSFEVSVFDGAHAFLFRARPTADGGLEGDFYSGDSWHDTWTARRDESARLADEFAQTTWRSQASLAELVLPDLDGRPRSLADPEFAGRAILIQLFGSWCPNCHDETAYLVDVDRRFRERGLVILGLAFELTGDFARDANQVRAFQQRWDVRYPLFVAGPADKRAGSRSCSWPASAFGSSRTSAPKPSRPSTRSSSACAPRAAARAAACSVMPRIRICSGCRRNGATPAPPWPSSARARFGSSMACGFRWGKNRSSASTTCARA
jgi:thiol-disulfide isomerase/thioredoxin